MKNVLFKGQYVRIALLFEAKNLHLVENLSRLSQSSDDWVRIASLRLKNDLKVHLKYIIYSKEITKKQFFNCKTDCRTNKVLVQNKE